MSILKFKHFSIGHRQDEQDQAQTYQWKLFISELEKRNLYPNSNQERMKQIFFSRLCLKKCLKHQGVDILWRDLLGRDYLELQKFAQSPLSLSHSKDRSLAAIAVDNKINFLGADIEHRDRSISDKIQDYMAHPDDQEIDPIKLWCLKEASFKAVGKTEKKLTFKDILIKSNHVEVDSMTLHWEIIEEESHILAICWK